MINGGAGDDQIDGGTGDDVISGGTGADSFVFAAGSGNDIVTDFVTGEDSLKIAADADLSIEQDGDDVVLTIGDDTMTLTDVSVVDLVSSPTSDISWFSEIT